MNWKRIFYISPSLLCNALLTEESVTFTYIKEECFSQLSPTSWYFVSPPFAHASLIWSRFSLRVDSHVGSFLCRVCGCTARPKVDRHCISFFFIKYHTTYLNLPNTQEYFIFSLKFYHMIYKCIRHLTEKILYRLLKSNENVKIVQVRQHVIKWTHLSFSLGT